MLLRYLKFKKKKKCFTPSERETEREETVCLAFVVHPHGEGDEKQREGGLECRHGEAQRSIHQKT